MFSSISALDIPISRDGKMMNQAEFLYNLGLCKSKTLFHGRNSDYKPKCFESPKSTSKLSHTAFDVVQETPLRSFNSTSQDARKGTWNCSRCTYTNIASDYKCKICHNNTSNRKSIRKSKSIHDQKMMADDGDKIRSSIKKSTSNSEVLTLNDGLVSHLYTSRNSRLRPKKIGDNANLLDLENNFESNIEVTTTSLKRKKKSLSPPPAIVTKPSKFGKNKGVLSQEQVKKGSPPGEKRIFNDNDHEDDVTIIKSYPSDSMDEENSSIFSVNWNSSHFDESPTQGEVRLECGAPDCKHPRKKFNSQEELEEHWESNSECKMWFEILMKTFMWKKN